MWLISFRWFKENCVHLDHDYDFNKSECLMGHDDWEIFTTDPTTREKHRYNPCKEKYCPALEGCKKPK